MPRSPKSKPRPLTRIITNARRKARSSGLKVDVASYTRIQYRLPEDHIVNARVVDLQTAALRLHKRASSSPLTPLQRKEVQYTITLLDDLLASR